MTRLEASKEFKRFAMAFIFVFLLLEVTLILATIHLSSFLKALPSDLKLKYSIILWILLVVIPTLINILIIYLTYVSAHMVMEYDQTMIRLKHPFREWSGPWSSVKKAYVHKKALNIQTTDSFWKTGSISLNSHSLPLIEEIKSRFRPGVWLTEGQARWYVFRHQALAAVLGAAVLLIAGRVMERKVFPDLNKQMEEYFKSHPKEREDR